MAAKNLQTSALEVKNRAKTAILSLYPHVKYHHYIEEGFDPAIVKTLFQELGLDIISPSKPQHPPRSVEAVSAASAASAPASTEHAQSMEQDASTATVPSSMGLIPTSSKDHKAEARKDRIKRLLEQKKAKSAPQTGSGGSAKDDPGTGTRSTTTDTVPAKTVPSAKDLLLQQKMDALEKSRAAATQRDNERNNGATAQLLPSLSGHSHVEIPGLVLASSALASTHRKRPVASDFVSDTPPPPKMKRPSELQQSVKAAADVSDEDVEMEMDSPTGLPPALVSQPNLLPNKANAVPDLSVLKHTSPTPVAATPPPISRVSTPKDLQEDLERRARAIENLKKRIAEAEARKAVHASQAKNANALLSNSSFSTTTAATAAAAAAAIPEDMDLAVESISGLQKTPQSPPTAIPPPPPFSRSQPIKLPDTCENLTAPDNVQIRERTVSAQLSEIESNVQQKMGKVKALEQELARLRSDLRQDLDEKERLTEEISRLDARTFGEPRVNDGRETPPSSTGICQALSSVPISALPKMSSDHAPSRDENRVPISPSGEPGTNTQVDQPASVENTVNPPTASLPGLVDVGSGTDAECDARADSSGVIVSKDSPEIQKALSPSPSLSPPRETANSAALGPDVIEPAPPATSAPSDSESVPDRAGTMDVEMKDTEAASEAALGVDASSRSSCEKDREEGFVSDLRPGGVEESEEPSEGNDIEMEDGVSTSPQISASHHPLERDGRPSSSSVSREVFTQ